MNLDDLLARPDKPVRWRSSALDDVRAFPEGARRDAGRQLRRLQQGDLPGDWKPLAIVGPGSIEIRIHADGEHRVIVVRQFEEATYVLHAFSKKTPAIRHRDIDLARRRYRALLAERRAE